MSNELMTAADSSDPIAALMGDQKAPQNKSSLARINVVSTSLKGEIEVGGKKIRTDVVPVGAYKITLGDDVFYAETIKVRMLSDRQQWQRWNASTNEMEKSVMSNSLNGDMMDSVGGFNLGRPSGYIEDFNALPEATKDIMRTVKRVKIFMGLLTVDAPIDERGEPISNTYADLPFIMDVKNRDSLKNINASLDMLKRKNVLPYMAYTVLSGAEASIPTGATYGYSLATVGDLITPSDMDDAFVRQTASDFLDYISYSNGKVLDLHNERNGSGISDADAAFVKDIIDNDFVEVPF
jgi:hypothetical protein|tara:strand:- start:1816 stop:2700 length:885 start_codon:yes stop_codon:yes gene_type:complete